MHLNAAFGVILVTYDQTAATLCSTFIILIIRFLHWKKSVFMECKNIYT